MDVLQWPWFAFAGGLLAGACAGLAARLASFCTLNAIERWFYAGDLSGLRSWALAGLVALVLTQSMLIVGVVDLSQSFYLSPLLGLTGAIGGGLMFGYGMALVGTCGFGALVRLGGGSLKSLVALIVLAVFALATQKGVLSILRVVTVDNLALDLSPAGEQSLPGVVSALTGLDLRIPMVIAVALGLGTFVFSGGIPRRARARFAAGGVIGAAIAAGWLISSLASQYGFTIVQIESMSFVVPVADTVIQITAYTGILPDLGVGMVIGVVAGAAAGALIRHDVRWEACDDARELSRHMAGAALMGIGGGCAMGCTIGQGVSALSLMAVSAPIVLISIILGARLGLAYLIGGASLPLFRRRDDLPAE